MWKYHLKYSCKCRLAAKMYIFCITLQMREIQTLLKHDLDWLKLEAIQADPFSPRATLVDLFDQTAQGAIFQKRELW